MTALNSKLGKAFIYVVLFTLMAGDAVRYTISIPGYAVLAGLLTVASVVLVIRIKPWATLKQLPWPLVAFVAIVALSTIWSKNPGITAGMSVLQLSQTAFALLVAACFSWRQITRLFANTIRFVLGASILFELYAAYIARGPVPPIFKLYDGTWPPSPAFYWSRAGLRYGERVQGIVGNSNLLAYIAMIGILIFAAEFAAKSISRLISGASLLVAMVALVDAWSMTINIALAVVVLAAVVSIAAEGKPREVRHRYYRFAWWAVGLGVAVVLLFRAPLFNLIGKSPDMTMRTFIWKRVLSHIQDRPLEGWGWVSYWLPAAKPYGSIAKIGGVQYLQAHNAFLDIWLQIGIGGLLVFVALIGYTFVRLWRLAVRHTSALYMWPVLAFVGITVQNLAESRMLIEIGWLLLVLFAVKVRDPEDRLEPNSKQTKRARLLSPGLQRSRSLLRKDR